MSDQKSPGLPRAVVVALGVAGALVLVVLGAVGLTLLRDEEEQPPAATPVVAEPEEDLPDPVDVVDDLVDAAEDGECAEIDELVTRELLASDPCASAVWVALAEDDVEVTLGTAVVNGERATVPAAVAGDEDDPRARTQHFAFGLRLAGEEWQVASVQPGDRRTMPPVPVLEAFFRAVFDGDCELATTYATPAYLERQGECMATQYTDDELAAVEWQFGQVRYDGRKRAVVPVTLTNGDDVSTGEWELVVREREWRVHRLPG